MVAGSKSKPGTEDGGREPSDGFNRLTAWLAATMIKEDVPSNTAT
jgi:hypothetical protein